MSKTSRSSITMNTEAPKWTNEEQDKLVEFYYDLVQRHPSWTTTMISRHIAIKMRIYFRDIKTVTIKSEQEYDDRLFSICAGAREYEELVKEWEYEWMLEEKEEEARHDIFDSCDDLEEEEYFSDYL